MRAVLPPGAPRRPRQDLSVVQWIERPPPKRQIQVRFLSEGPDLTPTTSANVPGAWTSRRFGRFSFADVPRTARSCQGNNTRSPRSRRVVILRRGPCPPSPPAATPQPRHPDRQGVDRPGCRPERAFKGMTCITLPHWHPPTARIKLPRIQTSGDSAPPPASTRSRTAGRWADRGGRAR